MEMAKFLRIVVIALVTGGFLFLAAGFWIPLKAVLAQQLLQQAWQKSLSTGNIIKPWPWADTWPVGRLRNGRLGVDLIVLRGESGEVLAFGPGHLPASSSPGEGGHCIIAGHRDTSFGFLRSLMVGDTLALEGKNGKIAYQVISSQVTRAGELYLDGEKDGFLTLITCFPFDTARVATPFRFIITAEKSTFTSSL